MWQWREERIGIHGGEEQRKGRDSVGVASMEERKIGRDGVAWGDQERES